MVNIEILNIKTNHKYKIKNYDTLTIEKSTPLSSMPLPTSDSENTLVIKLEGTIMIDRISFKLVNETEDLSGGTNATVVKTIWEQLRYLFDRFVNGDFEYAVRLTIYNPDNPTQKDYEKDGFLRSLNYRLDGGQNVMRCDCEFVVGMTTVTTGTDPVVTIKNKRVFINPISNISLDTGYVLYYIEKITNNDLVSTNLSNSVIKELNPNNVNTTNLNSSVT